MTSLIIIFVALSVVHFVYEAIILPSLRLVLRFKLFAVRDDLRSLKIAHGDALDAELFGHLHSLINNTIKLLYRTDLATIFQMERALKLNPNLAKEITRRSEEIHKQIRQCSIEEISSIHDRGLVLFSLALLANNGGLVVYLLPLAIPIIILSLVASLVTSLIRSRIHMLLENAERIALVPEGQLDNLVPAEAQVTA